MLQPLAQAADLRLDFTASYSLRAADLPAQTPQSEAEAAVGVQTYGDLPGGVKFTLQFDGATQGTGGCMRHLEEIISHTETQMMHQNWILEKNLI